jgi:hypothetical protein
MTGAYLPLFAFPLTPALSHQGRGRIKGTSKNSFSVIPAKAGIQDFQWLIDSRLRGNDDF